MRQLDDIKSKNEQIYEMLKKDILSLHFQPGQKISETLIASTYGVSRSPVRDALRRLKQENLIIVEPQVGTYISDISYKDLFDILEVKKFCDPLAAQLSAKNLDPDDLLPLREEMDRLKKITPKERYEKQKAYDDKLHLFIFDNCNNIYLNRICRDMFHYSERIRLYTTRKSSSRLEYSLKETEKVLSALHKKDPEGAYAAMRQHIENVIAAFEYNYRDKQNPSLFNL